jgi:AcrR family transcriptional regulator
MSFVTEAVAAAQGEAGPYRQRIIAAAVEVTASAGWTAVTMARLAEAVGVSRQTVYNEIGSKPALAEAMVADELGRFLGVVEQAFTAHPADLSPAIHDAVLGVLDLARDNTLLHAIVSATHGAATDLLPLLTTHAESLLTTAKTVLSGLLTPYRLPLSHHELTVAIDAVVRVVLSHVMQPSAPPARTASDIAWLANRVLHGS